MSFLTNFSPFKIQHFASNIKTKPSLFGATLMGDQNNDT
jgi:hypothetical protein